MNATRPPLAERRGQPRLAEAASVLACCHALFPDAPAEIVLGDVAAVGQVDDEQILEGRAAKARDAVVAEHALDVGRRDAGASAGLGGVTLNPLGERGMPLVTLRPGGQAGKVVRGGPSRHLSKVRPPSAASRLRVATPETCQRSSLSVVIGGSWASPTPPLFRRRNPRISVAFSLAG
jgi:hypothetical protein